MGTINPTYKDRIKYELFHKIEGTLLIEEPIGWKDDEKEYSRNNDYHGVFAKFSNNLKFVGSGADLIDLIDELHGINAEIKLTKYEKHPQTDEWIVSYYGYLDLSTKSKENRQLSVKFSSGGIEQALKSRESEKVEIDRLTTIDGKPLPPLVTESVLFEGRRIFLKTSFTVKDAESYVLLQNSTNGQTRGCTTTLPLVLVNKSHENAHTPIAGTRVADNSWERWGNGETGNMFFAVSDRDRILQVKFKVNFKVNVTNYDRVNNFAFWLRLGTFANGSNYNNKQNRFLFSSINRWELDNNFFTIEFNETISLLAGESLGLLFDQNYDGENGHSSHLDILASQIKFEYFTLEEDSFYEQSTSKFILAHEMAERLVAINTNIQNAVYSEFLGRTDIGYIQNGLGAFTGNTHGFWVRGFEKDTSDEDNRFKSLTTSFKDFMTSYTAVWNLGMGIEIVNRQERVRLENQAFFYNFNTTIKLPNQVKNVKRNTAAEYFYSSLEFGYEQGGDYEEAMGLDEYNARSTFTTIINRVKNTYSQICKYRSDSYGKEFARRKPKSLFSTEDSTYDDTIFMMDLKKDEFGIFRERKWQDDFDAAPSGIFSPETATNLRFSPVNMMFRHGWNIAAGLLKYPADYIRYGSSTANSALKTKLAGGLEHSENGNIINSELPRPRFKPEWVEFEHECNFEVMRLVEGTSIILGKQVPNFYGLVEFINEENQIEKGFLFNLKPNGNGQWKVLTANR